MTQRLWAVIPAAGTGSRFGAAIPKQYLSLLDRCVIEHSAAALLAEPRIEAVLVALHPSDEQFSRLSLSRHPRVRAVAGGAERADSVEYALLSVRAEASDADWVLVHDAARPCLTGDDLHALISQTMECNCGGLLAAPIVDTVKRSDAAGDVASTLDRSHLWRALTPQVFRYGELLASLRHCRERGLVVTDEASAVEHCGGRVRLVAGSAANIKVTYPEDLALAAFYLQAQSTDKGEKS